MSENSISSAKTATELSVGITLVAVIAVIYRSRRSIPHPEPTGVYFIGLFLSRPLAFAAVGGWWM